MRWNAFGLVNFNTLRRFWTLLAIKHFKSQGISANWASAACLLRQPYGVPREVLDPSDLCPSDL
jgi:hypothetical protein